MPLAQRISSFLRQRYAGRSRLSLLWGVLWRIMLGAVAFVFFSIILIRFVNPPLSSEMMRAKFLGHRVTHEWVAIEKISPNLIKAVIMSEDARFCYHSGVDWRQVRIAWNEAQQGDKKPRGASTITMQTVKNLFLWSNRSYLRKAIELPIAFLTDIFWSKQRQMEIYLNIVEWGPGIYGAKAAADYHFKKQPGRLSTREAAQLAAALPNPIGRRAGRPGPLTRKIASIIHVRMRNAEPWVNCAMPKPAT